MEFQELASEGEGEQEEEGAAPNVAESSVVVLEEVIKPRGECAFPRAVKKSMNAIAPVPGLMKLAELQNPAPMVRVPEYLSPESYFTEDYLVALDDLQEEGVNARLDLSPLELLNPPAGKERCVPPGGEGSWPAGGNTRPVTLGGMHEGAGEACQSRDAKWWAE